MDAQRPHPVRHAELGRAFPAPAWGSASLSWWLALSAGVAVVLALMLAGVPVFAAFLIMNIIGVLVLAGPAGFGMFANSIYATATIGSLAAVPLFILMGELLFRSGAMEVVFDSMDRLVGRIRGRQYVLCILLSAVLGALSGAAIAVAGLLGRSLFPTMLRRGYDLRLSAGTIVGGAALDPIIPPSILAVIVATLAQISTGKLLMAGILPGLLIAGMYIVYVLIRVHLNPRLAPDVDLEERKSGGSALAALTRLLPCAFIFFLVMGLVILGVATPTEAAATGVFGALVVAAYYGGLSWPMVWNAATSAARVSTLLLVIMCSAVMFSQLLTITGAARELGEAVARLRLSGAMMLFLMMALPFVLFMFLDQVAIMLVLIPIYQPLLKLYGFDQIWFWTLFLIVTVTGSVTPPFGYTLFALKSAAPQVPLDEIFRASWPFVWIIVAAMVIMALFPGVITLLPGLATR